MLRPEQIVNAKFTPINKGTYSADEVDVFLKSVADSYEELIKQNKDLIKKISILADKIESYRNDEEAIKLALLDAHRMSETINKNAKTKADDILTDAETRSKIILDGATRQANQSVDEAREKAKEIVDNARTAVSSLTERAQVETESTIRAAQRKAAEIIVQAENEAKSIIGNSKESYEFYSNELAKVKAETVKFKESIQELCKGHLSLLEGMPEFIAAVNAVSAVAEQVPVEKDFEDLPEVINDNAEIINEGVQAEEPIVEEIVVPETTEEVSVEPETEIAEELIEEPIAYVPEVIEEAEEDVVTEQESVIEENAKESAFEEEQIIEEPVAETVEEIVVPEIDEDDDDLFDLIDDIKFDNISDSISSDIDDLLPEISFDAKDEEEDFDGFKVDLDTIEDINYSGSSEDDDDIASLFDSMFED